MSGLKGGTERPVKQAQSLLSFIKVLTMERARRSFHLTDGSYGPAPLNVLLRVARGRQTFAGARVRSALPHLLNHCNNHFCGATTKVR